MVSICYLEGLQALNAANYRAPCMARYIYIIGVYVSPRTRLISPYIIRAYGQRVVLQKVKERGQTLHPLEGVPRMAEGRPERECFPFPLAKFGI